MHLLPWGVGLCLVYSLMGITNHQALSHHLMLSGISFFVGYTSTGLLSGSLYSTGIFQASQIFIVTFFCLLILSMILTKARKILDQPAPSPMQKTFYAVPNQKITWATFFLGSYLILLLGHQLWEVALRPTTGWDTIKHWSVFAERALSSGTETIVTPPPGHPYLVSYIMFWVAYVSETTASPTMLYAPWLYASIALSLMSIGYALNLSGSLNLGLFCAILLTSNPMLSAHTALGGYAEIWLAVSVGCCLCIIRMWFQRPQRMLIPLTGAILISMAYVKSTSVIYILAIAAGLAFSAYSLAGSNIRRPISTLLALMIAAITFVIISADKLPIGGQLLSIDLTNKALALNATLFSLASQPDFLKPFKNLIVASSTNNSYPFLPLVLLVIAFKYFVNGMNQRTLFDQKAAWISSSSTFLILFGLLYIGQIFSLYLLTYSGPKNDTSLTRASLPLYIVGVFLLAHILDHQRRQTIGKSPAKI